MNSKHLLFLALVTFGLISCCQRPEPTPKDLAKESLIPLPEEMTATGSSFRIDKKTKIVLGTEDPQLSFVGEYAADILRNLTSYSLPIKTKRKASKRAINLFLGEYPQLGKEGYQLDISEEKILLEANSSAGIFYGIQTLRQLLPESIEKDSINEKSFEIASGQIKDSPNYEYRAAMLDVSRHFFSVKDVKTYIDWLARYKMNVLHLHLSDDQGWRIEIKKWPKLTEIGGRKEVGGTDGGFYTQEEFKGIVKYARERNITIVPEIDMPGHTNAALASYAFLNCDNKKRDLYTGTHVGFSTFCTDKDSVYTFIDDVVGEISSMIDGPYFHIGGDESHVTPKKDYKKFVKRVQDIVGKHGKIMIGWDEVAQIELADNSVVHAWSSEENAKEAVRQGNKVIMSPAARTYLDMKYDSTTQLGLTWAGLIEVDHGYDWTPEDYIEGIKKENILGVECPLWSETVTNIEEVEFMVFPRLLGYAEISWTKAEKRNWEEYKTRLASKAGRLEQMGVNYYKSPKVPW